MGMVIIAQEYPFPFCLWSPASEDGKSSGWPEKNFWPKTSWMNHPGAPHTYLFPRLQRRFRIKIFFIEFGTENHIEKCSPCLVYTSSRVRAYKPVYSLDVKRCAARPSLQKPLQSVGAMRLRYFEQHMFVKMTGTAIPGFRCAILFYIDNHCTTEIRYFYPPPVCSAAKIQMFIMFVSSCIHPAIFILNHSVYSVLICWQRFSAIFFTKNVSREHFRECEAQSSAQLHIDVDVFSPTWW
jgi:hypothetical protein